MDIDDLKMQTLTQPRSNARERYAVTNRNTPRPRPMPRRPRPSLKQPQIRTWKERALFQGIICGGFLAVLLVFNILDTNLTNNVTAWVDRNLSYDIFAEDGVGSWTDRLLSIFNTNQPATTDYADAETPSGTAPTPTTAPTPNTWIDESILEEIRNP
ncbi:MAG: hypothetical protein FWE21_03430 [Defluviitaleaceae bacterium]|nr:hypothetical protein [Defluviitaleaceae bacterium]